MNVIKVEAPFIIGDVGSNLFRSDDMAENKDCALQHIREAKEAGCSAVKFQLFTDEELYGKPIKHGNKWAMPREWLPDLKACADEHDIEFMCTAFSRDGVKAVDPFVNYHKIASAEMMHWGILEEVMKTGKLVFISTGGATHADVFELTKKLGDHPVILLQCVACYPASVEDYKFGFFRRFTMFDGVFGVSDHTLGLTAAFVGVGAGATVFEKHFYATTSTWADTPDKGHSVDIDGLANYVRSLRLVMQCMTDIEKKVMPCEEEFVRRYKRPAGYDTFRPG